MYNTSLDNSVDLLINNLLINKRIPKFQFERAVEPFIAPFLAEWLAKQIGDPTLEDVAVEFPLKKQGNNQSTNADRLMYSRQPLWHLVEVKTDALLRLVQIESYAAGLRSKRTFRDFVLDAKASIAKASRCKVKYQALFDTFDERHGRCLDAPIGIIFVTPHRSRPSELPSDFQWFSLLEMFEEFQPINNNQLWKHVRRLRAAFIE